MDRTNFFKNYANVLYQPTLAREIAMAHEAMLKATQSIRAVLGRTNHPLWENPFTPKAQKAIKDKAAELRCGRLAAGKRNCTSGNH